MKKLTAFIMAAVLGTALMGCGGSAAPSQGKPGDDGSKIEAQEVKEEQLDGTNKDAIEESKDLLGRIQDNGSITIAMEGNWQPWTYEDEEGNLVGFEVEVSAAVAEKLGVEPNYVTGEWDGLLAGIQVGRYDLMANGVGYTEERAQAFNYSDFYAFNRTALVVRGDNDKIKSLEDLKGATTCNSANSTYQLLAENYGATVKDIETLDGTIEELLAGRVDATLNAEVSINDYMKEQPGADIKIVDFDPDVEKVGMIMPYGEDSESLQAAINEALAELRTEGKLAEISEKYFGMDITSEE